MPKDSKDIQEFGFFGYKLGGVITAEEIDSMKAQQEMHHTDINFVGGWVIIIICFIGGLITEINGKEAIVKTGGFALASSSLGAVIQRQASTRK